MSEIDETLAWFMHAIASNLPADMSRLMFNLILEASLDNSLSAFLSFELLVTDFLAYYLIVPEPHKTYLPAGKPISRMTLRMSNAHLGVAHPPPQLRLHVVELDPSQDKVPTTTTTDIPSSSTVPPHVALTATSKIDDAIATLFAHMNVIHTGLVERIGQVHERVNLIVEHQ